MVRRPPGVLSRLTPDSGQALSAVPLAALLEFSVQVLLALQRRHWRPQALLSGPGRLCWKMGTPECPSEPQRVKAGSEESGSLHSPQTTPHPTPRPAQEPTEVSMGEGTVQKVQSR